MSGYVLVDRLQFAFTLTYHCLFPILTMGVAILYRMFLRGAPRAGGT